MCIIIKRGGHGLPLYRIKKQSFADRKQSGFTLPEMLVSLCILSFIMYGVWQWGTLLYRTSDTMVQNQQAVFIAQQIYAGLSPDCPAGWEIDVASVRGQGQLYETTVQIQAGHRQWQFYYAGPEEFMYAGAKSHSQ